MAKEKSGGSVLDEYGGGRQRPMRYPFKDHDTMSSGYNNWHGVKNLQEDHVIEKGVPRHAPAEKQ